MTRKYFYTIQLVSNCVGTLHRSQRCGSTLEKYLEIICSSRMRQFFKHDLFSPLKSNWLSLTSQYKSMVLTFIPILFTLFRPCERKHIYAFFCVKLIAHILRLCKVLRLFHVCIALLHCITTLYQYTAQHYYTALLWHRPMFMIPLAHYHHHYYITITPTTLPLPLLH